MQNLIISPITIEHLTQYGAIYAAAFSGEPWNDDWSVEDATIHVRELLESQQVIKKKILILNSAGLHIQPNHEKR